MATRAVHWLGRTRAIVRGFVKSARAQIGYQLHRVQEGMMPNDYKPMPTVGRGVWEIRVHEPHEHRVIYVTKIVNRVCVLHAFEKKSRKTPKADIETARVNLQRLSQLKVKE